jgi:hypothetical protein
MPNQNNFQYKIPTLRVKISQTILIIVSAVMGGLAIILFTVGCLATGATRTQVYTGFRSRLGGRISTGFFTTVVYFLLFIWFIITNALVVPMIAYYMIIKNCEFKKAHIENPTSLKGDECLSLLSFGKRFFSFKIQLKTNSIVN